MRLHAARLRTATLTAASDASVSAILASPGDVLRPGDPVMTLVEVRPRRVVAYLEERRATIIEPGRSVVGRRRNGAGERVEGTIVGVSGGVTQFPSRFWLAPNLPSWGREFYIELPDQASLDPGEALDITLLAARPGPASSHEQAAVRR